MKRSGSRGGVRFDPERIVKAAVEAFLDVETDGRRAEPEQRHARRGVRRGGALALGVVAGIGARALYRRAREFDLEHAARALERRMVN